MKDLKDTGKSVSFAPARDVQAIESAYFGEIDLVHVPADHVDEIDHEGQLEGDQDGEKVGRGPVADARGLIVAKLNAERLRINDRAG